MTSPFEWEILLILFNSLFTQKEHEYNIIIYKLHIGEGHKKGEAKYNKCKKRKNKYKDTKIVYI